MLRRPQFGLAFHFIDVVIWIVLGLIKRIFLYQVHNWELWALALIIIVIKVVVSLWVVARGGRGCFEDGSLALAVNGRVWKPVLRGERIMITSIEFKCLVELLERNPLFELSIQVGLLDRTSWGAIAELVGGKLLKKRMVAFAEF